MTPEGRIKKKIKEFLNKVPSLWYYTPQDRYTSGIPDIIGCYRGLFFALEVKDPRKAYPSAMQGVIMNLISSVKGYAFVVTSVDHAKHVINLLKEVHDDQKMGKSTRSPA